MTPKERGRAKVEALVQGYRANLRELRDARTSEAVIRLEYLDPFWEALGWDVGNTARKPAGEKDVLIEAGVGTIEDKRFRHRRCDYFFRVSGFPRFLLEAKKPAVSVDDAEAVFQSKTYAWNAKIPFAVLTNFEGLRLFDATVMPSHAHPTRGLVADFKLGFEDYFNQWDALWDTFSREAVEGGSLDRLFASLKKLRAGRRIRNADRMLFDLRGTDQVDRVFLQHLEDFRERFAKALYRENRSAFPDAETRHGAANLTEATQRLIDRLVFIRVCEDREIMVYGRLLRLLQDCKPDELYPRLTEVFRELDTKYNGYLFKPHPLSERLNVDGTLLAGFIRSLYTPEGPYCFDRIGDDILGITYERFLGSVVTVSNGQVTAEQKPEVRHAGGVYYTPRFVVDSIIRRVIGPKIEGKSPREVLKVKVLDPACGSGSFLIAALQFLMEHCRQYVAEHPETATEGAGRKRRKVAFKNAAGAWHLSPEFRAELLTSCIHGVDIDQQAVEVTVMSLYIKMLEGAFPPNWQQDFLNAKLLPPLDNNIRCGNSLIDPEQLADYFDEIHGPLFADLDPDAQFRINPFAWHSATKGFGNVLARANGSGAGRGFDCIIGNPPYIRVQELNKWAATECAFYNWRYQSARGNFDIYVAFLERGLELLAPAGLLGFICPHKFWQASYGAGIRELIAQGRHLRSVVDFGHQQVFDGATTYTAIHVLSKSVNRSKVDYARVEELADGLALLTAIDAGQRVEGATRWKAEHPRPEDSTFAFVPAGAKLFDPDPAQQRPPLGELCALAQGIKTSADKVFVVSLISQRGDLATVQSEETQRVHEVEAALLRPLIKSEHMRAFDVRPSDLRLLFPYDVRGDEWRMFTPQEMAQRFPRAWNDYLLPLKSVLEARERSRMKGREDWYGYIYPKNFVLLSKPKLLTPDMADRMRIGFDEAGEYIFSGGAAGGVAIVPPRDVDPWFLMGVLNSALIETHVRLRGQAFRGGWLNCEIRFIRNLPIQLPRTAAEKRTAERIAAGARAIVQAKQRLRANNLGDNQRERHEREIETQEAQINRHVNQLYGVKASAASSRRAAAEDE